MSWEERQADEAEWERERLAGLDAECNRLRKALETQAAAVRALESTRASRSAYDQRVLDSLEAKSRAELLGELDSLRAERDAFNASLRDVLEGRTTPPTEAERVAHEAAGGLWRWVSTMDGVFIRGCSADGEPWVYTDDPMYALPKRPGSVYVTRYWALNSRGELTAWPKVKA